MLSLLPLLLHLTLAGSGEIECVHACVRMRVCRMLCCGYALLSLPLTLSFMYLSLLCCSVSHLRYISPSPSPSPHFSMTHAPHAVTASTRGLCHRNTCRPPLQVVRSQPNRAAAAVCKEWITAAAAAALALVRSPLQFLIHL